MHLRAASLPRLAVALGVAATCLPVTPCAVGCHGFKVEIASTATGAATPELAVWDWTAQEPCGFDADPTHWQREGATLTFRDGGASVTVEEAPEGGFLVVSGDSCRR